MSIPNVITLVGFALVPLLIYFLMQEAFRGAMISLFCRSRGFITAAASKVHYVVVWDIFIFPLYLCSCMYYIILNLLSRGIDADLQ